MLGCPVGPIPASLTPAAFEPGRAHACWQRSCGPAFSGISLAAAKALLSFPSMRQIQPPHPRSRLSRSRPPARWSQSRRQRARQKLCGSYRPKLWSAPTVQPALSRRSCCFLTVRAARILADPPHRRETDNHGAPAGGQGANVGSNEAHRQGTRKRGHDRDELGIETRAVNAWKLRPRRMYLRSRRHDPRVVILSSPRSYPNQTRYYGMKHA